MYENIRANPRAHGARMFLDFRDTFEAAGFDRWKVGGVYYGIRPPQLDVAKCFPSGLKAIPQTLVVWARKWCGSRPVITSQTMTELSSTAATCLPSGLKATPNRGPTRKATPNIE